MCTSGHSLFDWQSKTAIIISKPGPSLMYAFEALFTQMLRKDAKDPFSADDLRSKGGS